MKQHELNPEDIQKQLIDLVTGEDLVHHAEHVLTIWTVQAGDVPAQPLLLALFIHPGPVRVLEDALILELQTVVGDDRHAELPGKTDLRSEDVAVQVWMPNGNVTGVVRVTPMVLRVKHHALGSGVASGPGCSVQVCVEVLFGRSVELPLHHAVRLERRNDSGLLVPGP